MKLGIAFLEFQYQHFIVLLTRDENSRRDVCINASRAALRLLKQLVSNSMSLYNGITWYARQVSRKSSVRC